MIQQSSKPCFNLLSPANQTGLLNPKGDTSLRLQLCGAKREARHPTTSLATHHPPPAVYQNFSFVAAKRSKHGSSHHPLLQHTTHRCVPEHNGRLLCGFHRHRPHHQRFHRPHCHFWERFAQSQCVPVPWGQPLLRPIQKK